MPSLKVDLMNLHLKKDIDDAAKNYAVLRVYTKNDNLVAINYTIDEIVAKIDSMKTKILLFKQNFNKS